MYRVTPADATGSRIIVALLRVKAFIDQISAVSPHSHPQQFKDGGEQLRYWMTAYNAWVLYIAASEYPT